ncbi:MAG: PilW family protein [Vitreoscilla sp.]
MKHQHTFAARRREAGFTLVEMMVAITVGLVVVFGMTATFVSLKNTFKSQDKLGQLQDSERIALTFLTTAINNAGYYPDPKSASPLTGGTPPASTPVSPGGAMPTGAYIFGTAASGGNGESLQTSFATLSTDNLISCLGTTYAGAGTAVVRNIYYVDTTNKNLMCRVLVNNLSTDTMANGGTPQVVVPGVSSMSVLYGIAATGSSQVTHYVDVGSVANWTVVKAVRITLNFTSPFGGTDISRTHTINLMN